MTQEEIIRMLDIRIDLWREQFYSKTTSIKDYAEGHLKEALTIKELILSEVPF